MALFSPQFVDPDNNIPFFIVKIVIATFLGILLVLKFCRIITLYRPCVLGPGIQRKTVIIALLRNALKIDLEFWCVVNELFVSFSLISQSYLGIRSE